MLYSTQHPLTTFAFLIAFLHIQTIFSMCVNGQQGCQNCYNNSYCNTCQQGYLITTNNTCQQCHVSNCQDCHSGTYQCDWCLPSYYLRFYACNICIPDNCLECTGSPSTCTSCYTRMGVNPMGQCQNCSDSNCQICSHYFSECTTCQSNHGFDSSGYCYGCNVAQCISCYSNYLTCEVCISTKGPSMDRLSCQYCYMVDVKCQQCPYDVQLCLSCIDGYGVQRVSNYGGICRACQDPFCRSCAGNYQRCTYCLNGTGVAPDGSCIPCDSNCTTCPTSYLICTLCDLGNGLTTARSCQICFDAYCVQCYANYTICQKCGNGTGLDINTCVECYFHCLTCSPYNFDHCTTCQDGMFVNINNGCQPCITGCTACFGQNYNCSSCTTQYYHLPNNTCSLCPGNCLTCFYNSNYSAPECTSCYSNSSLVIDATPIVCGEYCGDSVTTNYDCDNQIGVPYDGCNNFCQIQPLFNCSTTNRNICSYNGILQMNITHFQRNQFQNKFFLKVQIFPPLYAFTVISQQQFNRIFCFSDPNITIQSITYDSVTHELSISADFSIEFADNQLYVIFQPEKGSNEMFFAGRNQNVNLRLNGESQKVYHYSQLALFTIKIVSYLSYCVVALGWLACIIGLLFRKLQGLQAMFVLQFSWLTFVWLGCPLYLQIEHALLLKYSSGYNYPFIAMNTTYSKQSPYLSQFKLSTSFLNNFNLCGITQIIGIVGVIIAYLKVKQVLRQQKQAQFSLKIPQALQISQKIENYLQETKQNLQTKQDVVDLEYQRFEKFNGYYQVAEQSLLYATLFNLIYFTQCTVLLFLVGQILNVFNISCLAVYFVLFFIVILRFIIYPHPCGYFRYSFNQSKKFALEHYIFFPLILIAAVALLPLTSLPYLSGVPLFLFFLYNLIRKPYKKNSNNYRAALNLFVMCSFIGLRVFMNYWSNQVHNSVITNTWLLFNIVMLIVIALIGLAMMIWQYYLVNYKLPHMLDEQKKTLQYAQQYYRKQILKQLSTTKMNEQVGDSKKESILKTIVPRENKLVDYSNKLNNQNRKYQRNKLTTIIYQQQEEQAKNNQLLSYKKLLKQNKQKQKGLQYETNNYGSNQKIKIENEVDNRQIEKAQKQNDEQSQIKQIKERVAITILKDQNKFVQYKAALEYVASKTDYVQRKVDATNIELYQRAYEDI